MQQGQMPPLPGAHESEQVTDAWPTGADGKPRAVLYVAGPMTNQPFFGRPVFETATDQLRRAGYHVLNPARQPLGLSYREYMRRGENDLIYSDGVALLPGWEDSPGATHEKNLAQSWGLDVRPIDAWPQFPPVRNTP